MMLITKEIEAKLRKNGEINRAHIERDGNTEDFKPVLKLFDPYGPATWLVTEISDEDDGDMILFGLCDLGMGEPEMGYISLNELKSLKFVGRPRIERDRWFEANKTLREYADEARNTGRIMA